MRFIGTSKVGTDPFSKGLRGQQAIVLDDVALGVHPFGFDGIEPGYAHKIILHALDERVRWMPPQPDTGGVISLESRMCDTQHSLASKRTIVCRERWHFTILHM